MNRRVSRQRTRRRHIPVPIWPCVAGRDRNVAPTKTRGRRQAPAQPNMILTRAGGWARGPGGRRWAEADEIPIRLRSGQASASVGMTNERRARERPPDGKRTAANGGILRFRLRRGFLLRQGYVGRVGGLAGRDDNGGPGVDGGRKRALERTRSLVATPSFAGGLGALRSRGMTMMGRRVRPLG